MSYRGAQHLYISMLFSSDFCTRVFNQPEEVQKEFGLDVQEIKWFTQSDRRAFATDPLRATRALASIMDESAASTAQIIRTGKTFRDLELFFGSPYFHDCVRNRGSMILSFFEYLLGLLDAGPGRQRIADLIHLEQGIARVRRAEDTTNETGSKLRLSPRIVLLKVTPGTLRLFTETEAALARHPIEPRAGVVDAAFSVPDISDPTTPGFELLLVELPFGSEAPTIENPPAPLFQLLKAAEVSLSSDDLLEILHKHGALGQEGSGILANLCADGILVPA
jgi:hypothetical protein